LRKIQKCAADSELAADETQYLLERVDLWPAELVGLAEAAIVRKRADDGLGNVADIHRRESGSEPGHRQHGNPSENPGEAKTE
jgi:hypothetical protein